VLASRALAAIDAVVKLVVNADDSPKK